jgi:hypothetical protein
MIDSPTILRGPKTNDLASTSPEGSKGEPSLLTGTTSNYNWLYSDKGSGAHMDVTIYRPSPSDHSYFILGDYAQGNYSSPTGNSLIVKAINDDPLSPLLKNPVGFNEVWNDHGSGGDYDGSIWYPVPPDGYRSLGYVCQSGYNAPSIANYACVRKDYTTETTVGSLIWKDQGSGAKMDVALYQVNGVSGIFVAQGNYEPFSGTCFKLAGS